MLSISLWTMEKIARKETVSRFICALAARSYIGTYTWSPTREASDASACPSLGRTLAPHALRRRRWLLGLPVGDVEMRVTTVSRGRTSSTISSSPSSACCFLWRRQRDSRLGSLGAADAATGDSSRSLCERNKPIRDRVGAFEVSRWVVMRLVELELGLATCEVRASLRVHVMLSSLALGA
jgi:hypothetical protein